MLKNRTLALTVGAISVVYAGPDFIAAGIPELSTWLMMIIGFGGVCVVRARRANPATATA